MRTKNLSRILILALLLSAAWVGPGIWSVNFAQSQGVTASASSTAVNGDAEALALPNPGAEKGQLMMAQITYEKGLDALPLRAPEGWKEAVMTNAYAGGGNKDIGQAIYYKVADGSEPASFIWIFSQKVKALGGIVTYEGADAVTPIFGSSGQGGYGDSTGKNQLIAPGISGVKGGMLITYFGFKEMAYLESPLDMRQVYQEWDYDNDYSILAAAQSLDEDSATGSKTAKSWEDDALIESVESEWVAQSIVLRPSGAVQNEQDSALEDEEEAEDATAQTPTLPAGEQLKAWKLIEGGTGGNLDENRYLTRSEMMVIFARMMGEFDEAYAYKIPPTFTDGPGHWATPYVAYAEYRGWTSGLGNNQFGFDMQHRAREAAVFMLKALGYKADVDFNWENAFEKAKALGLFSGVEVQANDNILRGDLFEVMVHALRTNKKNELQPLGEALKIF